MTLSLKKAMIILIQRLIVHDQNIPIWYIITNMYQVRSYETQIGQCLCGFLVLTGCRIEYVNNIGD